MPAGSKTDLPLAKAKPISASVITYLRRKKNKLGRAFAAGERSEKMGRGNKANKYLYKCALVQSIAFWNKVVISDQAPGPGTYTLPRLVGPNTAYTHASPCYSMKGKSKHNGFAEDLSKVSYASLLSHISS
ncbi:outer dense fiber protein 3-like [Grus japonensis]|uniref:Outer dense fiber protein 3-like n=1 Tax=Grus japonensis TaxID=30415 RepID=A0ABC9WXX6_GRUJA